MILRLKLFILLYIVATPGITQNTAPAPKTPLVAAPAQAEVIPERNLTFSAVEANRSIAVSPITTFPPLCNADGYLFLDMLDPQDLKKHTVASFRGNDGRTYSPSVISDLNDITILSVYPGITGVAFLLRGSKEQPGAPGPGKSPAGITWKTYHNYIAFVDKDGTYKGSIALPVAYHVSQLAIFPTGEYLVFGFDEQNDAVRLLLLDSSGKVIKPIDLPGSRNLPAQDATRHSIEAARAMTKFMGSVLFTPYNADVLVWRTNSADPILDIDAGGGVREVPLQTPTGFVFVNMLPANDRWVGHFRVESANENAPLTMSTYAYFELRPQDASVSARLAIPPDVPQQLACEDHGSYINYKTDKDNKLILLKSD